MHEQTVAGEGRIDEALSDFPIVSYARRMPAISPPVWPRLLAAGAGASHVVLALALILGYCGQDLALLLALVCIVLLGPLGAGCGLAGIGLARWHLNGWVVLVSILTLPLNVYFCLLAFGVIPFEFCTI